MTQRPSAREPGAPFPVGGDRAEELPAEVARIWEEVLEVSSLDQDANFFELGGHSLLVFKILSRVESSLGLSPPVSLMFEAPVLGDFVAALEEMSAA